MLGVCHYTYRTFHQDDSIESAERIIPLRGVANGNPTCTYFKAGTKALTVARLVIAETMANTATPGFSAIQVAQVC